MLQLLNRFRKWSFACGLALTAFAVPNAACGSTLRVLYAFHGGSDGGWPLGTLIKDSAGNLYGTTSRGGVYGRGTVYEMIPSGKNHWTEKVIYSFCSLANCADGWDPGAL